MNTENREGPLDRDLHKRRAGCQDGKELLQYGPGTNSNDKSPNFVGPESAVVNVDRDDLDEGRQSSEQAKAHEDAQHDALTQWPVELAQKDDGREGQQDIGEHVYGGSGV